MGDLRNYVKQGRFFKAVVEDGSDIIFVIDYTGVIYYVNASVKETLNYYPKNLVGKNFFDYLSPECLPGLLSTFKKIKRRVYEESIEFQFLCKDGSYKYLEFNSINLKPKEEIEGFILDCRDITQRKKDAEELRRAQETKEQFLAYVSHEIRTPINGMAGMALLLSQNPSASEQATYLSAIRSAADNLNVIINDLLDIASIESGKLKFEKIGFNLYDLLQSLDATFSHQIKDRGVRFEVILDDKANQIVLGDPVRLNQILINLVSNAIKFTHSGFIRVRCTVQRQTGNEVQLQFEVADTGIGIPKDKLKTIFESYSQADASVTRKYGGTGLGLTIVKRLVELQGGKVNVKSVVDQGSTFSFSLAYQKGHTKSISTVNFGASNATRQKLSGLNILLVEDNEINRIYAESILKTWGCNVVFAENGAIAVDRVATQALDIVLMDIQMPVMDGFEATKAIRSLKDEKSQIPIIALTANARKKDVDRCKAGGMNECVSKPFTPEDLYSVIKQLIDLSKNNASEPSKIKPQTFDLSYLKKVSNDDDKFVTEIITTFLQSIPKSIAEIRQFLKVRDWEGVAHVTHKLKPSITLLGLHHLKQQASEIENSAKAKEIDLEFRKSVDSFCTLMEAAMVEIAAHKI